MRDCAENRAKFVGAVSRWLLQPVLDQKTVVPQLSDYGLCKSCALELYSRFSELVMTYTHDVDAIVAVTQDLVSEQADSIQLPKPQRKALKH